MKKTIRRATGLSPILFALAFGAYAQEPATDHSAHDHAATESVAETADPASAGYSAAMDRMHQDMAVEPTGNADADFVIGMIPHHQAAIDMAKVVLEHGEDPEIRKLAEEVISAQEGEIAMMQEWLERNGYAPPAN
ncbi:DUF305 domain-containing protein [Paracoccus caeni]|uniref:DUF305 domain-containing protein n=1 Tax=Paracoccus caeni TaxID=657651 RepID=A0A934SIJ3_9RHOB|nr:DUF305 domain-containing protein [Paracoccus caeni]MBK4215992.1 DUF305 domain-containing protein [Paracoccus caeni]